ncbi:MAG: hypothetical protein ACLFQ8_02280 [Candidatus Aenigmatarchaeota archaeon]
MPLSSLLDSVAELLSSLLPEQFLGLGADLYSFLPIVVFIVFVYLIYRSLKIAFHGMLIFVAGALFPIFANNFFGTAIPIAIDSLVSYGLLALVIYLGYVFIGTIATFLKIVTWPFRKLFSKSKDVVTRDELDKEVEEILEEEKD